MCHLFKSSLCITPAWVALMSMLVFYVFAQCPVTDLPSNMNAETESANIVGGNKVNLTCKHEHRAFHPVDGSKGITGNTTHNMWFMECDNSTNNFTWPNHPNIPACKCIVSSALLQYSGSFQANNFTSEALEGTDPINVGDKITFKCNENEAEAGSTMSNQYSVTCASNGQFISDTLPTCSVPKVCNNAPNASDASGLANPIESNVKAHRSVPYSCKNSSLVMDTHGKEYRLDCNEDGSFAAPTWPVCREAGNCTGYRTAPTETVPESIYMETIPVPPDVSGLENSTSNLVAMMEWDEAVYKCKDSNHVVGDGPEKEFHLKCKKDNGEDGIGFDPPETWPSCKEPLITTTIDPLAPTTPEPLKPCQCLGDIPVDQARNILDRFCRNYTIEGNMAIYKARNLGSGDYEGYTPPSRARCGSRNPEAPELKDHCFCSGVEKQSNLSFWMTIVLKTEPWQWTLDYSTTANKSDLLRPHLENYKGMKEKIEKAIDDTIFDTTSISTGYVGSSVSKFIKGEEVPMAYPLIFPTEKPKPKTTTAPTTTTNATTTASSENTTSSTANTTTNTTSGGRKKRSLTMSTGYNYINVEVNLRYTSAWSNLESTWNDLETFFNNSLDSGQIGDLPISKDCNRSHICRLWPFEENPTCGWDTIIGVSEKYDINTRLGKFERPFNATNATRLEAGDIVELQCAESTPKRKPVVDQEDDDELDGIVRLFCMSPTSKGQLGSYYPKTTPIPECTVICEDPLPTANNESKMTLKEVQKASLPTWAKNSNKRLDALETFNERKHLFSGDRLVYHCDNEIDGVYGGIDETFESFKCTDEGLYDVPNPSKEQLARGEHGWPICFSQEGLVIRAVETMLDRYDRKISDRYKMIDYQEQDNQKEIIVLSNYFLNTTVPTILGLAFLIFLCCCCTRKGSPICNLCRGDS